MSQFSHTPVLFQESIESLKLAKGSVIVDCTLGLGGHSKEILKQIGKTGKLIAIDQDEDNLQNARKNLSEWEEQIVYAHDNFGNLRQIFKKHKIEKADGIFFDLGISSVHLDQAEKGFSIRHSGPLDMRMDRRSSLTAADVVNTYAEDALNRIFWEYGEEKFARKITNKIIEHRKVKKFERTDELVDLIESVKPKVRWGGGHPAVLVFQALRIEVNRELEVLKKGLEDAINLLAKGGRIVVISYHSLEDRIVKKLFKKYFSNCHCPSDQPICNCGWKAQLKKIGKLITPSQSEIKDNPRSRSAKMRVSEKII